MNTRNQLTLLSGVGLGAGLMYLFDPKGGHKRRAAARSTALHGLKTGRRTLHKTSIHLGKQTRGLLTQAGSVLHAKANGLGVKESLMKALPLRKKARLGDRLRGLRPQAVAAGLGALAGSVGLNLLARG